MDFRTEFFPLLNKALYKENNDVPTHIVKNGDVYLMNRYTSFYNPKLTFIINNTIPYMIKLNLGATHVQ